MPTQLEIVAPDRLLLSQPVDMVVIPAAEGDMGVLPGHSPMIVLLRGKCYLRMQYLPAEMTTLEHATTLFTSACENALEAFPR